MANYSYMNAGIIGTGLIGRKRALSFPSHVNISRVCDVNEERAKAFADEFQCSFTTDWKELVSDKNIDAVFIATTHDWLAPIAKEAIQNGKHVFMEKPGARSYQELQTVLKAHSQNPVVVMLGYNHRFHPSMQKAKEIITSGTYGDVLFIRAKYGHGGRLGYEKEWRFIKEISGGGELVDQGPHLIDLVNFFAGEMNEVTGFTPTLFWDTKLDDSAFFIMRNEKNQYAQLSVSCVEWKNLFQFEIMLKTAKIQIDGLGRSYGKEHLTLYKMKPEMGPPDKEEFDFPEEDNSWKAENDLFFSRIESKDTSPKALEEGLYVWKVIEQLYNKV